MSIGRYTASVPWDPEWEMCKWEVSFSLQLQVTGKRMIEHPADFIKHQGKNGPF